MFALRFLGILALALCAFSGAFLLAYAAILCSWIVYADYAGTLGGADGSAAIVALVWAPLGALAAGLLCAASLIRLGQRGKSGKDHTPAVAATQVAPADPLSADLDRRLAEHGALLRQLQALTRHQALGPDRPSGSAPNGKTGFSGPEERRVA